MRVLVIAAKSLREIAREPQIPAIVILFPALMVLIYYAAYGSAAEGFGQYLRVMVDDRDAGAAGAELVARVAEEEFEGQPVFSVAPVEDAAAARVALLERKATMLLTIPEGFSRALAAGETAELRAVGDTSSLYYTFADAFLQDLVRAYAQEKVGREELVRLDYEFLPGTGTMNDFDGGVPGLIVFGVLLLILSAATVIVREQVGGTLRRLRLTHASAADLLLGVTLGQLALAVAMIAIVFGTALACGFQANGSVALAMAITLGLALSAVGFGLIIAGFADNDGLASGLGGGLAVPMALLSGALFPLPDVPLATVAGQDISAFDLLPPTHAVEALRRVLVLGEGAGDVAYEICALFVFSAAVLAAGVAIFHRRRLRAA